MKAHTRGLIRLIGRNVTWKPRYGVEVGVYRGENSQHLLRTFPGLTLLMVDPWKEWEPGSSYHDSHKKAGIQRQLDNRMGIKNQAHWDKIKEEALSRVSEFGDRAIIFAGVSEIAIGSVPDNHYDFVFLDANHMYEEVRQDIKLWLPKVRVGGVICGHDYGGQGSRRNGWGVERAVDEAFGKENIIRKRGLIWGWKKT